MTNYEALIEAIEELEKIKHLPNEVQQNVYLASIAQSLARLADAIEQREKEQK